MDAKPKLVRWIVTWSVHWVFYQNNSRARNKEFFKRKLKKVLVAELELGLELRSVQMILS